MAKSVTLYSLSLHHNRQGTFGDREASRLGGRLKLIHGVSSGRSGLPDQNTIVIVGLATATLARACVLSLSTSSFSLFGSSVATKK